MKRQNQQRRRKRYRYRGYSGGLSGTSAQRKDHSIGEKRTASKGKKGKDLDIDSDSQIFRIFMPSISLKKNRKARAKTPNANEYPSRIRPECGQGHDHGERA